MLYGGVNVQLNNISGTISGLLDRYAKDCTITTEQGQVITAKVMASIFTAASRTKHSNDEGLVPVRIGHP